MPAPVLLRVLLLLAVAVARAAAVGEARAQEAPAATATPATAEEPPRPLGPEDLVTMDFQDVELATLVKFISEITGRNFVVDDRVKGKVSIVSPSKITVEEAYRVFQSVLQVKGFSVVDTGPVVKIVPIKDIKGAGLPIETDHGPPADTFVTRLVPLQYLESTQAAQVLQPLVSRDGLITAYAPTNSLIVIDTAVNISRLLQLIGELDVPGQERTVEVIPLSHAYAGDLAQILREAIEDNAGRGRAGAPPPPAGIPGVAGTTAAAGAARSESAAGMRIVPDERSNAIIMIGSPFEIRQARALIARLDVPLPRGAGRVQVVALRHADATEMVQVLADLVGTTTSVQRREILPGRAVTEGGGRFGSRSLSGAGTPVGGFPRSVISNQQAGSLGQMTGSLRGRGAAAGGAFGGGGPGGIASAGTGGPAIEFESGVRITADAATNSLVISAAPQDFAILEEVIQRLDIARRQVLVEAVIFEVSLTRLKQLGIELQGAVSAGNLVAIGRTSFRNLNTVNNVIATGDPSGLGSINGLLGALIGKQMIELADGTEIPAQAALLSALQSTNGVNVLSAPNILTTDNEEAEIVVGQNVPFVTSRSTNETNLENTFSQIDRRDVGITLRLTPQISEGDTVRLLLFQEVSALVPTSETQVLQLGPTTTVRSATTNVVVQDAETVAIGGLISDSLTTTDSGVPYLTEIPVLGNLFKFQDRRKEKVNLIILLTPHVIRDAKAMRHVTDGEKARFREAMTGKHRFSGTQASLAPSGGIEPAVESGGILLPAEGPGAAAEHDLLPASP
jgi:general secretion pathway protein D